MKAELVARFITEQGQMSLRAASKKMGRSPTFLATLRGHNRVPQINTMAEIADVYGYDLLLRKREDGSEIIIEPSK